MSLPAPACIAARGRIWLISAPRGRVVLDVATSSRLSISIAVTLHRGMGGKPRFSVAASASNGILPTLFAGKPKDDAPLKKSKPDNRFQVICALNGDRAVRRYASTVKQRTAVDERITAAMPPATRRRSTCIGEYEKLRIRRARRIAVNRPPSRRPIFRVHPAYTKGRYMSVRRLICTWLSLCPLIAGTVMAQPVEVPGFTHVRSLGGIDEYRLDANGLTVLAVPDPAATVVSFQVLYRVGSRNEAAGTTGDTHLLEHLMFKGSRHYNKALGNSLNSYMERVGANFNATTSMDRTNYFGTLGRDALEGYIAIEADRMRNLLLRPEDLASEMTVVRNEYERGENSPFTALFQQVMATAYQAHPYHHPTIGWRSDIEHANVDKLRRFYDTFYWPDNATVILVGDFQPDQALGWIRQYYGGIPRAPKAIPAVTTEEPPQQGPRRLVLKRAGATGNLIIAFKGPRALDPDAAALTVLGLVLSQGKSSRLYRALVDTTVATQAGAGFHALRDPGPFVVTVSLPPDAKHEQAEKIAWTELERIKTEGVTREDIQRVLGPYRADQVYQRDGVRSTSARLGNAVSQGDWTLFVTELEALEKVTPADVQRVARKYLVENQSTTGWFVPEKSS
ncbi:M16 family metallopeptidase [Burkholderia contaminans]|uniref:M16 family metallopeptidase n=1 Tax=Burkholderia contaminans TaxID=488447 RepID=UPI001FC8BB43|nr:pitrilysin family protein [Burkholderia contaminans]